MIRCLGCMKEYDGRAPGGGTIDVCPWCGYVTGPAKEAYHLPPGSILQGKYIVGKVIGFGGFGVTYICYDQLLGRKVAIKEYFPTNFSTRVPGQSKLSVYSGENEALFHDGLKSFIEEAKRLIKFNPLPGTVDINDCFQQNETGYIVMEYLEGRTIKEALEKNGVFEYAKAKTIVLKILEILKEVHKEGIIHRDISPDNIFLLEDGDVRLIDFGAARYSTMLHTKSLTVILKPGYAPEEQYRSHGAQGSWSDVYALAATFYKMVTGVTPEESLERLVEDNLKEPSKLGVRLPQSGEKAIMAALAVKAPARTQSADEFARQLTAEDEGFESGLGRIYKSGKAPGANRDYAKGARPQQTKTRAKIVIPLTAAGAIILFLLIMIMTMNRDGFDQSNNPDLAESIIGIQVESEGDSPHLDLDSLDSTERVEISIESEPAAPPIFNDCYASSVRAPMQSGASIVEYNATNVFDGDWSTAWCEGVDGPGIGEWIEIRSEEPQFVSGIRILNGYYKSEQHYYKNNAISELRIITDEGESGHSLLLNYGDYQDIIFYEPVYTTKVRFVIGGVYLGGDNGVQGGDNEDTLIGGILVY